MLNVLKRLWLGFALIALAAAILLFADRGRRTADGPAMLRVAILQHANTTVLDDGLRGTLDALAERGFRDGERLTIERFNAQGDMPTGIAIARQIAVEDDGRPFNPLDAPPPDLDLPIEERPIGGLGSSWCDRSRTPSSTAAWPARTS